MPYAGGGTAVYHRWRGVLPPSIDLIPILLPGRESRIDEPPLTDLRGAAAKIADQLHPHLNRPWGLFGHSMGAWLAFEVIRELRHRGARRPELLVAAASRAPHISDADEPMHLLPDDQFVRALGERFDGIPPAVRNNPELLKLLLPALRADVQMVETYQYTEEPPLDMEILALGGTEDRAVSAAELTAWRRHTTGTFSARLLPGGHFFMLHGRSEAAALQIIASKLEQVRRRCIEIGQ